MADEDQKQPEIAQMFVRMSELWREQTEKAVAAGDSWSQSMMPFLTARAADSSLFGAAQGGSVSEAIKRMADGPRLADIANLDKQMYEVMAAWTDSPCRSARCPWSSRAMPLKMTAVSGVVTSSVTRRPHAASATRSMAMGVVTPLGDRDS